MLVRIVGLAAILAVMALYCFYTAKRLDRLHERIDMAGLALDAQLRNRAVASRDLLRTGVVIGATEAGLDRALAQAERCSGLGHEREVAENAVSRLLADIAEEQPLLFLAPGEAAVEVHDEALRASFARRFYNDTVRDALTVRDKRVVRWLRLAGHAPHPAYFEMDDEELPSPSVPAASVSSRRIPLAPQA
jgi:hypothetical protein